jgi:antitoxin (DNA-binding transcriptional repressor) of toxin-antitoxin stability system
MLEAKTQWSKLFEAVLRGEEAVIANCGKPMVKLVKADAPRVKRVAGAWAGLMTDAELEHAFSPEVEAEVAREWLESMACPIDAGVKSKRREKAAVPAGKTTAKRATTARRAR